MRTDPKLYTPAIIKPSCVHSARMGDKRKWGYVDYSQLIPFDEILAQLNIKHDALIKLLYEFIKTPAYDDTCDIYHAHVHTWTKGAEGMNQEAYFKFMLFVHGRHPANETR